LDIIIDQHTLNNIEIAEKPKIVNAGSSISPTIQTDTTSNGKSSNIPMGRYADIVKNQIDNEVHVTPTPRYIPRTIRIQPTRFADCLNATDTTKVPRERQEEGTLTTSYTSSGKTEKERELEAKNEKLEREVEELKKGLQNLQLQMFELITALNEEKKKDATPQRKKYKTAGKQKNQTAIDDATMAEEGWTDPKLAPKSIRHEYLRPPQDLYPSTGGDEMTDNTSDLEEGTEHT
jgi:hypothetical protein